MSLQRRYPGVRPFESTDKNLFFGREGDVADLGILITLEKLVVLFGKSGYGKSSLINAGLIPALVEKSAHEETPWQPLLIRLGSYTAGASISPLEHIRAKLREQPHQNEHGSFLEDILDGEDMWLQFKKRQIHTPSRFLLIFDQFEEFFTYPREEQEDFNAQLQNLLYLDMPQMVRERLPEFNRVQRQLLSEPLEIKVLIAIRADRLNLLHSVGEVFPAILDKRSRFELKGLSYVNAAEAIRKPAIQTGDFESPQFGYSDQALDAMLDKLSESKKQRAPQEIEAFQLQILCEYLETEIISGHIPHNQIEPEHFIQKIDAIYEGYYQRLLDKLPPSLEKSAQQLIEESLIFEDETTGEARRLSVDADVLVKRYNVTHDTLQQLENTFLLRREANSVGSFSYEVSHDTLLGAILTQKHLREKEAEKQVQLQRELERRRKEYRQRLRLAGSTGLAVLGFGLALLAWQKSQEAEKQRQLAEIARNEAINLKLVAEQNLIALQTANLRTEALSFEYFGDSYFNLGKYEDALENYRESQKRIPEKRLNEKIEACLSRIK